MTNIEYLFKKLKHRLHKLLVMCPVNRLTHLTEINSVNRFSINRTKTDRLKNTITVTTDNNCNNDNIQRIG